MHSDRNMYISWIIGQQYQPYVAWKNEQSPRIFQIIIIIIIE